MIEYKNRTTAQIVIGITMFLFAFFGTAYVQLTSSILSYIIEAEHYTDPLLSNMIVTISSLAQIPACLLGAYLGQKMDKKRWSYFGILCFLAGSMSVIIFSRSLYLVLFCRLIVGFGSGILILLYTAILPDFYEGKSLSVMLGVVTSGGGFWGFLFSGLSANLCASHGWKTAYLLHLFSLVPLVLFFLFVPRKPLVEPPPLPGTRERKTRLAPKVFLYSFLGALLYLGVQVIWSSTSLWMRGSMDGTAAQIGIVSGLFSLFSCSARLVFGWVYNRMGRGTLALSAVLLALGLLGASQAATLGAAIVAASLVGAAMGFTAPACLNLGIAASPENQVAAQAVITIGFATGQFISTYWSAFIGGFCNGSLPGIFQITAYAVVVLLGATAMFFTMKKTRCKTKQDL